MIAAFVAAVAALSPLGGPPPAADSAALRRAVTVGGVMAHERAFQRIANRNGGNRAAGSRGYDQSAAYVAAQLREAGYEPILQRFSIAYFQELAPPVLERRSPGERTYAPGADFATMRFSGTGDVTAQLEPVDVVVPPAAEPDRSTSGCERSDFAGFRRGRIALLQRGTCPFRTKVRNAQASGASAVIVFNEGQPGRIELAAGTLGTPGIRIPALATTFAVGAELYALAQRGPVRVRVAASTTSEPRATANVVATTSGRATRRVVVGAHLDSVPEGPGINDNGSGSAAILEIAQELAELRVRPRNQVVFAWFGAEEEGLIGSTRYVRSLAGGIRRVAVNLNFDMIASPNFVRFVYGSGSVDDVFRAYFDARRLAYEVIGENISSDSAPFLAAGVAVGGLFTGATGVKTAEQEDTYGGTAGAPYDACYHRACDTLAHMSTRALDQTSDAAAHAVLTFAQAR